MAKLFCGLLLAVIVVGCIRGGKAQPAPRGRVVLPFTGEVDAAAGTIRITGGAVAGAAVGAAFVEIPVVQDGRPGSGPADTVELVTESAGPVPGGCGAADSFTGRVRLRSFYAGAALANAYAEITTVTPIGHEGCNSAPPPAGLSAQYGLFAYGTVGAAGTPGDSAAATWSFGLSKSEAFTFHGRIVADLVTGDVTAPEVVATPPAGTYTAAQTVTLSCLDGEAGCQAVHYTTSGADPTTASSVYAGPLTVSVATTLKFLAIDHAGNTSAVQTAAYAFDLVPPAVASVTPRDGKTGVDAGSAVTLTFSEPMQVATTAAAIAVTGPSGPVAGTVTPNGAGTVFTFTPSTPLPEASKLTATVSSEARDVAGNALPAFQSWFTTPAPTVQVSGATQARYENGGVAYNSAGNGLAVWVAKTLTSFQLVSARFTATSGTWAAPTVLYTAGPQGPAGMTKPIVLKVVSSGTGFLVAWSTGSFVEGILVDGAGVAGPVLTIHSSVASSTQWAVAAGSAGYAVLAAYLGTVTANVYNGATWATSTIAGTPGANDPFVAFNGTTYVGGYVETFGPVHVATYSSATRTWSATVPVPSTQYAQVDAVPAAIAASGNTTCVLFVQGGVVKAAVATTGPLAFNTEDALSVAGSSSPSSLTAAVSPGTYPTFAAAWLATAGGVVNAYGALRGPVAWYPPVALEAQGGNVLDLTLVSLGYWNAPSFLAAMQIQSGATSDLHVNATSGMAWGAAQLVESSGADASRPALAATPATAAAAGVVTWDQDDGTGPQLHLRPVASGTLGAALGIGGTPPEGSVKGLRTASRTAGELMAVWAQDERNGTAVYAALRTAAGWSAPVRVASRAQAPAVASNGSTYLVAYQRLNGAYRDLGTWWQTPDTDVEAAEWNGSAFDAPIVLATNASAPWVASDGLGYAAAWTVGIGVSIAARIREGGTWGAVRSIGPSPYQAALPALGGKPGEYLLVYLEKSTYWPMAAQRALRSGGSWSWTSTSTFAELSYRPTSPAVAASSGGWGVTWYNVSHNNGGIDAVWAAVWDGAAWTFDALETGPACTVGNPAVAVASLGAGFRFSASCTTNLNSYSWEAGAWGAPVSTRQVVSSAVISTDGARYRMLATMTNTTPRWIGAIDWIGATLQSPTVPVDTLPAYNSYYADLALPWDGTANVGLWTKQQASNLAADRLYARWSP